MSDPYLGEIRMFAGNFAPQGWALCNGQSLSISQNTALFSLIGTYYGGNGTTNFNLPNLQGRVPVATGNGAGLSPYTIGQTGGTESVTLNTNNLPAHVHTFAQNCSADNANKPDAVGSIPATVTDSTKTTTYNGYTKTAPSGTFPAQNTSSVGGNTPVTNLQPYLAITYIIALVGIYPPRI